MNTNVHSAAAQDGVTAERESPVAHDWKAISMALAQRCLFAVENLNSQGPGLLLNTTDGTTQHWRDYIADALDLLPGMKVDRERMNILHLPRNKRRKALRDLDAQRATALSGGQDSKTASSAN